MKRIRILHRTEYHYHAAVTLGPHRAMMRPREGHDLHIEIAQIDIEPLAAVRWVRDIYGNSIAVITFVTGYIQMAEGQHGATHAWTEIYLPGAGWRGFDPTNNKLVGAEHVSVAVSREQEKASPLSGAWEGAAGAFDRLEVSVQVFAV